MVVLDVGLIRSKSGHHSGLLVDLEELSLHQCSLEGIDTLSHVTPKLRILYLQNNCIGKIEGLHRLRSLEYLNLAINNISLIENLSLCEKLNKLDLTLNFIPLPSLLPSLLSLQHNIHLKDLYLTGNPCTSFPFYRPLVLLHLPSLRRLDGEEVGKGERIKAEAEREQIEREYKRAVDKEREEHKESSPSSYSPEQRLALQRQSELEEKERERQRREGGKELLPEDTWKAAQDRMAAKVIWNSSNKDYNEGTLPSQRNTGKYAFILKDSEEHRGHTQLSVDLPVHLSSSLIDIDVQGTFIQLIINKKHNLLLHLSEEVQMNNVQVKRIQYNGKLIINMKKVNYIYDNEHMNNNPSPSTSSPSPLSSSSSSSSSLITPSPAPIPSPLVQCHCDEDVCICVSTSPSLTPSQLRAAYYTSLSSSHRANETTVSSSSSFTNSIVSGGTHRNIISNKEKEREREEFNKQIHVREINKHIINEEYNKQIEKEKRELMETKSITMGINDVDEEEVPPLE